MRTFIAFIMFLFLGISAVTAQQSTTIVKQHIYKESKTAKITTEMYTTKDGKSYPVYLSKNGKKFIIRISENGKKYNYYLKK